MCSKFLVNNVIPVKKKIGDMFRSYSALIAKYMFFALSYYFNLKSKWKTNVMNKVNFTDSKKLKIQTSMLRSKKVIKKNVKKFTSSYGQNVAYFNYA